jgi:hypothetical protein
VTFILCIYLIVSMQFNLKMIIASTNIPRRGQKPDVTN